MPVQPNYDAFHSDLDGPEAVARMIDVASELDPAAVRRFGTPDFRVSQDIADHLNLLAATQPEWFAPFRGSAVTTLAERLSLDPGAAAVLLAGIEDDEVDDLVTALEADPVHFVRYTMLAAIDHPAGLAALGDLTRAHGLHEMANAAGVHVGQEGPARRRFSPHRSAVHLGDPAGTAPVGLPVEDVAVDAAITWHYLSLDPADLAGAPTWPHRLVHVVAPRTYFYTLQCAVTDDGRYVDVEVDDGGEPFDAHLGDIERDGGGRTTAAIRPYDADLVFRNGHVLLTPGVVGTAGGPPLGLYPTPVCPGCGVLMFHVVTVESRIREYGDGFRSAFICEDCVRVAVTGTSWN